MEYLPALKKGNSAVINHEDVLSEISQLQKDEYAWFHLYELSIIAE